MDFHRLLTGTVAHGEHTYLTSIQRSRVIPPGSGDDAQSKPLLKVSLSFESFSVIELWRVGATMSLAIFGLGAVSFSAFHRVFIFNTLFPYYDSETPRRLVLTPWLRLITCGLFGSNHRVRRQ